MITIKEASEVLSLTPQRIKQILNEKEIGHIRTQHNNGQIKILPDGMASLMHLRKKQIRKRKVILKGQKGGLGSTSLCLMSRFGQVLRALELFRDHSGPIVFW
jgi:hypothetical protein